jgi:hypothetical protein
MNAAKSLLAPAGPGAVLRALALAGAGALLLHATSSLPPAPARAETSPAPAATPEPRWPATFRLDAALADFPPARLAGAWSPSHDPDGAPASRISLAVYTAGPAHPPPTDPRGAPHAPAPEAGPHAAEPEAVPAMPAATPGAVRRSPVRPAPVVAERFRDQQLAHTRVRIAQRVTEREARALFERASLPFPPAEVYLRAFKRERVLELWARATTTSEFRLVKQYPICTVSGRLGPKRRQGDLQVPEGFYRVAGYNPDSRYHLSLAIDYPNRADRLRERGSLGGDIFIHGDCRTVGCLPITDPEMEELYWIVVEARSAGQTEIPVHIFPTRMDAAGMALLRKHYDANAALWSFWMELKPGFDAFERERRPPRVEVDATGRYVIGSATPILGEPVPLGAADSSRTTASSSYP